MLQYRKHCRPNPNGASAWIAAIEQRNPMDFALPDANPIDFDGWKLMLWNNNPG